MARQPLQLHRQVEQTADVGIVLVLARQFRNAVERAFQIPRIGRVVRDELGEPVNLTIAHLKHAARILEHCARFQTSEGNDLRDGIMAVFRLDVADDFPAPCFTKIDVEVGHRHARRVEEAFKQQSQFERIEIGNCQRPRHDRPGTRPAPRPDRNPLRLCPFDEIGNDQEITGEAHADDDVEFEVETVEIVLAVGHWYALKPCFKTGKRIDAKLFGLGFAIPRKARQNRIARRCGHRATLCDDERVRQRIGQVGKQRTHVVRGFDPRIGVRFRAVVAFDIGRCCNAQHDVVRAVEVGIGIARGVGRHERQPTPIGHRDQMRFGSSLRRVATSRNFDIKPVGEQRDQPVDIGVRRRVLAIRKQFCERPFAACGQRDQAVGVAREPVKFDMRLFIGRTVEMRGGHQRAQILIARPVLCIEREPVVCSRRTLRHIRARDAQHCTDDRLHALFRRCLAERHDTIKPVAVADCGCRKAHIAGLGGNILGIDCPFEHRVRGENTKRNELRVGHRPLWARHRRFANGDAAQFSVTLSRAR